MSNLGGYQKLTTYSKQVGGPLNLVVLIGVSGAAIGIAAYAGIESIVHKISASIKKKKQQSDTCMIYTIQKAGISNEGLQLNAGDRFNVLEIDGDACLINLIDDIDSPYFVSLNFISRISDYPTKTGGKL